MEDNNKLIRDIKKDNIILDDLKQLSESSIVCYKLLSNGNIEIIKLFDNIIAAKREGFSITNTSVKKNQLIDGYYWSTCKEINKTHLEELLDYLEKISSDFEKLDLTRKSLDDSTLKESDNFKIICCDKNLNIIKIYDNINDVSKDNLKKSSVYKALYSDSRYLLGYYWYKMDEWNLLDKLNEYYKQINSGRILSLKKKSRNANKIQVVKCDLEDNVLGIYKSLHDIDDFKANSISKVLQKDDDREYKNFLWYRLSEYMEKYPDREKYIDKVLDIIEDEEEPAMKILLTISGKLISVNELYKARISFTAAGRPFPVLYKNPKAVNVSNQVRSQLLACDFSNLIPWLNRTKKFSISINFILKSGITRRDCANFEKIMCDDLTRFIKYDLGIEHFDDSEFYECQFVKSIIPDAKHEYAYIVLKESYYQERADIFEHPKRIYLGGQYFPNIDWRPKIEKEFEEISLETYNPVNDIWSPEYRSIEKYKKCNTILYVLTPGDYTRKLGCEIINMTQDSYYYGDNKFIVVAILGTPEDWGEDFENIEFLEENTRISSKTKFEYFNSTRDIVEYIKQLSA